MRSAFIAASLFGLVTVAGCPDRTISEVNPEQGRVEAKSFPIKQNRNVDLLFVIDDSGSMQDKQQNLKDNFPNFIDVLNSIQGGLPDVHIGVVTSDMGMKGEDVATPGSPVGQIGQGGCANTGKDGKLQVLGGAQVTGSFISDIKLPDGSRQTNYQGDLATTFGQMAQVGATGCGFEQHLAAMRRGLENPANAGFLRPDAFLAVIFLADEDDCSMKDPNLLNPNDNSLGPQQSFRCTVSGVKCDVGGADIAAMKQIGVKDQCHPDDASQYLQTVSKYVTFLKSLKPDDPKKIIVAGIMGVTDPFAVETRTIGGQAQAALAHSCTYNSPTGPQNGDPPIRLQFFLDQFPERSTSTTICQPDLSGGLQQIGELVKAAVGDPCIESPNLHDRDPNTAGVQPECSVSYIFNFGKPNSMETILSECNATATNVPCWHIIPDAVQCPVAPGLILKIEDPVAQPDGTQVVADCVTDA